MIYLTEVRTRFIILFITSMFGLVAGYSASAQTFTIFTNRVNWEAALPESQVTENFADTNLATGLSVVSQLGAITNGVWFDDVGNNGSITTWNMTNMTYAWGATFDLTHGQAGVASGLRLSVRLEEDDWITVPADITVGGPAFFGFVCNQPFTQVRVAARPGGTFLNDIYSTDDLSFSTGPTNTARWIHAASGDWSTPSHWDINSVPNVRHSVIIDPATSLTVTGPVGPIYVQSLSLAATTTNPATATLALQTNSGLWSKDAISVGANGRLVANGDVRAKTFQTAIGSSFALNGNLEFHTPAFIGGDFDAGQYNVTFSDSGVLHGTVLLGGGNLTVNFSLVTLSTELRGAGTVIGLVPALGSSLVSTGLLNYGSSSPTLGANLDANGNVLTISMPSTPSAPARLLRGIDLDGGRIDFPRYVSFASALSLDSGTLRFGELDSTNTIALQIGATVLTESVPPLTAFNHQVVMKSNLLLGAGSTLEVNGRFFGYGAISATNARIEASADLYLGKNSFSPPLEVKGNLTVESPIVTLVNLNVASGTLTIEGNLRSGGSGSRATAGTNALIVYSGSISNSSSCDSDTVFNFDGAGIHRVGNLFKSVNEQFDAAVEFTTNAVVEMTLQSGYNSFCERDRVSSKIIFNSSVAFGGSLRVVKGLGISFSQGDVISLFEFHGGSPTGEFANLFLPVLPGGLVWSTNRLYVDGTLKVASTSDTDADGLADLWEMEHFGSLSRDGSGDFDGDGASDLAEFISGTDPKNVTSTFLIRHLVRNTTNVVLTAGPILPGRIYTVEQSFDLTPFSWFATSDVTTEQVSGDIQFTFPTPTENYFFRVRVSAGE